MRWLLALLALAGAAAPAASQPDTLAAYFPFAVGNRWEFVTGPDGLSGPSAPNAAVRWTAVADTVVEGRPAVRLLVENLALDGTPGASGSCTVARHPGFGSGVRFVQAGFCPGFHGGFLESGPGFELSSFGGAPAPVEIGGVSYDVVGGSGYDEFDMQASSYRCFALWQFGRGVGLLHFETGCGHINPPPAPSDWGGTFYTLVYAEVGGAVYGQHPVAAELLPAGGALALEVAPNPVRGLAALDVTLPAPADVRVEVYDVTGRRALALGAGVLATGAHRLPLDTGPLAPGVYVVRLTAGEAAATARLVVAR